MKIGLIAFTGRGEALADRISARLDEEIERCDRSLTNARDWTAEAFGRCGALIFVGAAGIAVRLIALHIRHKASDPAVVVVDEAGRFVIPILSGHLGGGNALASRLSALLGAVPVITTATDVNGVFAVDDWARRTGCRVDNPERIKEISAALLRGEEVFWVCDFPREGKLPAGLAEAGEGPLGVSVSLDGDKNPFERTLRLIPRIVTVGVGCRRGAAPESLKSLVYALLEDRGVSPRAVEAVTSIDLKREEPAVLKLAEELGVPAFFYSAEALAAVPGVFTASQRVKRLAGVDNVCERSAVLHSGGEAICPKTLGDGVTASLALRGWKAAF